MFRFLMSCLRKDKTHPRLPAFPQARPGAPPPGMRMIDVEGMLRQASTRVSVDQLVKKGKKYINLLSRDKIDELINRSVKTIVDKHRVTAAHSKGVPAAQIEAESRAEFDELLHQFQRTSDAESAVERSKKALEQEMQEIRFEFDPEQAWGEDPPAASAVAGPLGAFEDFARELDKHVVQVFKVRRLILERSESPEAAAELDRIEEILRAILSKLLQAERGRFAVSGGDARETEVLKRRMEKLLAHVATMEAALKTLSTAKTFSSQQVQNMLRDLGLAQEDKNFEKKKEMLKIVLSANQGIRKEARELAARGITLDAPTEKAVFTRDGDPLPGAVSRSSA